MDKGEQKGKEQHEDRNAVLSHGRNGLAFSLSPFILRDELGPLVTVGFL